MAARYALPSKPHKVPVVAICKRMTDLSPAAKLVNVGELPIIAAMPVSGEKFNLEPEPDKRLVNTMR